MKSASDEDDPSVEVLLASAFAFFGDYFYFRDEL
jgi:hypothetical protein